MEEDRVELDSCSDSNEVKTSTPFHPQLECPVCHKLYDVPMGVYNSHKSGYRICAYCHARGWCNEMQPFNFKEELNMPFGKTNFGVRTTNAASIKAIACVMAGPFDIEKVIFNAPATIVKWLDGSKTVVKGGENDEYDPEKGLAMCFAKKALGNKGHYYETFKEWLPEEYSEKHADISDFAKTIGKMFSVSEDWGKL